MISLAILLAFLFYLDNVARRCFADQVFWTFEDVTLLPNSAACVFGVRAAKPAHVDAQAVSNSSWACRDDASALPSAYTSDLWDNTLRRNGAKRSHVTPILSERRCLIARGKPAKATLRGDRQPRHTTRVASKRVGQPSALPRQPSRKQAPPPEERSFHNHGAGTSPATSTRAAS